MNFRLLLSAALGIAFLGMACSKEKRDQDEIDRQLIEEYLTANNLTATAHPSGIYYIIDPPGNGGNPTVQSTVQVKYKGYLLNQAVFDQTKAGQSVTFSLANLIPGWQIAIPLLKRGGKGTFWIPSELGYGSSALPGIPANSVLIFEIELIDFQ